uniref:Uncharacterized protein n=1 Tax=Ectopseudomonas oleovorans TaxID=301 RepID=A0A653B6K3_ECTOL
MKRGFSGVTEESEGLNQLLGSAALLMQLAINPAVPIRMPVIKANGFHNCK